MSDMKFKKGKTDGTSNFKSIKFGNVLENNEGDICILNFVMGANKIRLS